MVTVRNARLTVFASGDWTLLYSLENCQLHSPTNASITFKFFTEQDGYILRSTAVLPLFCHMHPNLVTAGKFASSFYPSMSKTRFLVGGTSTDCGGMKSLSEPEPTPQP